MASRSRSFVGTVTMMNCRRAKSSLLLRGAGPLGQGEGGTCELFAARDGGPEGGQGADRQLCGKMREVKTQGRETQDNAHQLMNSRKSRRRFPRIFPPTAWPAAMTEVRCLRCRHWRSDEDNSEVVEREFQMRFGPEVALVGPAIPQLCPEFPAAFNGIVGIRAVPIITLPVLTGSIPATRPTVGTRR